MPTFQDHERLHYKIEELYNVIKDVHHYPDFIPWCKDVHIVQVKHDNKELVVDLKAAFGPITEKYRSLVKLEKPFFCKKRNAIIAKITSTMISGPFEYIDSEWELIYKKNQKVDERDEITNLKIKINFKFKTSLIESLANLAFNKACAKIKNAFLNRVEKLYGIKN